MPLTYLESSALVKLYIEEAGSAWVASLCRTESIAVSILSVPEVGSALARRTREGAMAQEERDKLFQLFLQDTRSFLVVDMSQAVARQAAAILLAAPPPSRLRSLDALHLATALSSFVGARRRGVGTGSFVTADRALAEAAAHAGLPVINPEDHAGS